MKDNRSAKVDVYLIQGIRLNQFLNFRKHGISSAVNCPVDFNLVTDFKRLNFRIPYGCEKFLNLVFFFSFAHLDTPLFAGSEPPRAPPPY